MSVVGFGCDHRIEDCQELPCGGDDRCLDRFARGLEPCPEGREMRTVSGGMKGRDVKRGPDDGPAATDGSPSGSRPAVPGNWCQKCRTAR